MNELRPGRESLATSRSVLLIIPYFGNLPTYADLFFRSCAQNPSIEWLVVTDQSAHDYQLPKNVRFKEMSFDELRQQIETRLGFRPSLDSPYKLCDLRPAFGVIFADDVRGFDHWGHCDTDIILGDLRSFITEEILRDNERVLAYGHLSIYRNVQRVNHFFLLEAPGIPSFREAATSTDSKQFDETAGINRILDHHKVKWFHDDLSIADINPNFFDLRVVVGAGRKNFRPQCFYWENGKVFQGYYDGSNFRTYEYMYIHLQKRRMSFEKATRLQDSNAWYITPRGFSPKGQEHPSIQQMRTLNPRNYWFDLKSATRNLPFSIRYFLSKKVDWAKRVAVKLKREVLKGASWR